jgi:hypothetical protein
MIIFVIAVECLCKFLYQTVTTQQLMKYVCNFKQYFATCFGFQEAIIR